MVRKMGIITVPGTAAQINHSAISIQFCRDIKEYLNYNLKFAAVSYFTSI